MSGQGDRLMFEALLGRREREVLADAEMRRLAGQRVLITGAGGSIGAELARQVAECRPAALTLFEQSEYNLFSIERELLERVPDLAPDVVLGDVSRLRSIGQACRVARPHVVYHAAAYKHVTMVERAIGPALETNVFGTLHTTRAAAAVGARFVLVSSDKAAQPESVMGATKRLAELVCLSQATATFRPVVVRFGNVLGSSGSVMEVMLDCIRAGKPIPLTDREATRYFMTVHEAVSLVLKADALGHGGDIYWLDMGQPVKIRDLAERLLALSQEAGYPRVPIEEIGLRPGEKLREELTTQGLGLCRTTHRRIWQARQRDLDPAQVRRVLRALRDDVRRGDTMSALADLCAAVPEFRPSRQAWDSAAARTVDAVGPSRSRRERHVA